MSIQPGHHVLAHPGLPSAVTPVKVRHEEQHVLCRCVVCDVRSCEMQR